MQEGGLEELIARRGVRRDKGQIKLMSRDAWALTWVGEQEAVRLDQLRVLLGRQPQRTPQQPGVLSLTTVRRIAGRWEAAGLAKCKLVLARQPAWVYLSAKGLRELGLPYREVAPRAGLAMHLYWVNQVRLWHEQHYPSDRWVSERQLRKAREATPNVTTHLPDAEVYRSDPTGEVTVIAIEVELTVKEGQRTRSTLQELADAYDGVWYFTTPATQSSISRAIQTLDEEVRHQFRVRDLTITL